MKILNDLFSLLSGTGEEQNLKKLVSDPIKLILYLAVILIAFIAGVAAIVFSIL